MQSRIPFDYVRALKTALFLIGSFLCVLLSSSAENPDIGARLALVRARTSSTLSDKASPEFAAPAALKPLGLAPERIYEHFDHTGLSGISTVEAGQNLRVAQTFSVAADHAVWAFEFFAAGVPVSPGTIAIPIVLEFREVDAAGAPGNILVSATLNPSALSASLGWVRWDVRSFGLLLRQGQSYALAAGGLFSGRLLWQVASGNQFPAGATYESASTRFPPGSFAPWAIVVAGRDAAFRVIGPGVPPSITFHPQSYAVSPGQPVTFSVTAVGDPPLSYQWMRNGVDIGGAAMDSLTLPGVAPSDAGDYSVRVSNSAGSATSQPGTLTVNVVQPPALIDHPVSRTVRAGASVSFCASASGAAPLAYQWRKNGVNIPGAASSCLPLVGITTADAGDYSIRVSNSAGDATSQSAKLTVLTVNSSASRTLSASFVPNNPLAVSVSVTPDSGVLAYAAEEQVPPGWTVQNVDNNGVYNSRDGKVRWGLFLDDQPRSLRYQVTPPGNASGTVSFTGAVSFDGLSVTVAGATTTTHSVGSQPVVSVPPVARSASVGQDVTFCVTASGTPPLYYQWRKGASDIPNATGPCLTLRSIQALDAGEYTVRISNGAGAITTQPVVLTVNLIDSKASRTLPSAFLPNAVVTVSIEAVPGNSVMAYAVEDSVPPGWSVQNISDSGTFDALNRTVKWGLYFDNQSRRLQYEVIPPGSASGTVQFSGRASFDGASIALAGDQTIAASGIQITVAAGIITIHFSGAELLEADSITGPWIIIATQSPYQTQPRAKMKFYTTR